MVNRELATLQVLVNRYKIFEKYKSEPQNKEICEKEIKEAERLIIETVLKNDGNPVLEKIFVKWDDKKL